MKQQLTRNLQRFQQTFTAFTAGQKMVAVLGTAALLLAGVMVFRWAAAPSYTPLFSGLAPADASAIIDELDREQVLELQQQRGVGALLLRQRQDGAAVLFLEVGVRLGADERLHNL